MIYTKSLAMLLAAHHIKLYNNNNKHLRKHLTGRTHIIYIWFILNTLIYLGWKNWFCWVRVYTADGRTRHFSRRHDRNHWCRVHSIHKRTNHSIDYTEYLLSYKIYGIVFFFLLNRTNADARQMFQADRRRYRNLNYD